MFATTVIAGQWWSYLRVQRRVWEGFSFLESRFNHNSTRNELYSFRSLGFHSDEDSDSLVFEPCEPLHLHGSSPHSCHCIIHNLTQRQAIESLWSNSLNLGLLIEKKKKKPCEHVSQLHSRSTSLKIYAATMFHKYYLTTGWFYTCCISPSIVPPTCSCNWMLIYQGYRRRCSRPCNCETVGR